jgi:hypothetical protein
MRRMPTACPSCGSEMIVTELSCTSCETVVRGRYTGCTFCALPDETLRFLELFVSCRGNIKEMERETGLGYWTIRGRLDDVIRDLQLQLHGEPPLDPKAQRRRAILEAVERGELSPTEAEQQLVGLAHDDEG